MKTSLKCTVQIKVNGLTPQQITSVKMALEPDNIQMPKGLKVVIKDDKKALKESKPTMRLEFSQTQYNMEKKGDKNKVATHAIGYLVGTVDEVLEHVQVALKVIGDD